MSDLAGRIQWVLDSRDDPETGARWEANRLSRAAGLGSVAHVGMIRRGTLKKPTGDTLAAIARAASVSTRWLITGEGSPDSLDADEPSVGASSVPIYGNALGWDDAVLAFLATPAGAATPRAILDAAAQHGAYHLDGPVSPEVVTALVRLVTAEMGTAGMTKLLRESDERMERLLAAQPAEAAAFWAKAAADDAARAAGLPLPPLATTATTPRGRKSGR